MENSVQSLRNSFRNSDLGREDLDLAALFKSMDKDGDGKISYNEFIVGATNKSQLLNEENLRVAFDLLDLNGDGKISTEEIRSRFVQTNLDSMDQTLDVGEKFWQKLFEVMDKKHRDGVTFEVFRVHMVKLLDAK